MTNTGPDQLPEENEPQTSEQEEMNNQLKKMVESLEKQSPTQEVVEQTKEELEQKQKFEAIKQAVQKVLSKMEIPEDAIEKARGEVGDIGREGAAYSYVKNPSVLKPILEKGFLGTDVKQWKESFRERNGTDHPETFFNITGRTQEVNSDSNKPEVGKNVQGTFGIVFDISKWKEASDDIYKKTQSGELGKGSIWEELPPKSYFANFMRKDMENWESGEKIKVECDKGFRTPYRISPKFFKGIVIPFKYKFEQDEEDGEQKQFLSQEYDFRMILKDAISANLEAAKKTGRMVPIYDGKGNMLWPDQKTYQEIKEETTN
jgi:hypothetical protein